MRREDQCIERLGYRPALDGLRGIAILLVLSYHVFEFPRGGYLGVDLFFVLSGFLITTLLIEEDRTFARIALSGFYRRRLLRLFPAFIVFVLIAWIVIGLRGELSTGLMAYTGLHGSNFVFAAGEHVVIGVGHLWTLAMEEQFYIVWPSVLVCTRLLRISYPTLRNVLGVATVAVFLWRLWLYLGGAAQERLYYAPDTRADALLIGCLLGLIYATEGVAALARLRRWAPAAILTYGAFVWFGYEMPTYVFTFTTTAISCTVLVAAAIRMPSRFLEHPWLVWFGRLSYSLYLWHVLVVYILEDSPSDPGLLSGFGALTASVLLACASYYWIERPFLRLKDRRPPTAMPAPAPELGRPVALNRQTGVGL